MQMHLSCSVHTNGCLSLKALRTNAVVAGHLSHQDMDTAVLDDRDSHPNDVGRSRTGAFFVELKNLRLSN